MLEQALSSFQFQVYPFLKVFVLQHINEFSHYIILKQLQWVGYSFKQFLTSYLSFYS